MKKEIIWWYSKRHYQPHKMIVAGEEWGYNQAQVEAAMIHCYNKIVNEGKKVADVDVARYVKNVCKDVDSGVRDQELKILYESKAKLEEYKRTVFGLFTMGILISALLWLVYITWGVV